MSTEHRNHLMTPIAVEEQLKKFEHAQVLMLKDLSLEQLAPLNINQHAIPFSMIAVFVLLAVLFSIPYFYFDGMSLLQLVGLLVFIMAVGFTFPIWFLCYGILNIGKLRSSRAFELWLWSKTSEGYKQGYQNAKLAKQVLKQELLQKIKIERSDVLVQQIQSLFIEYQKLYYDVSLSQNEKMRLIEMHTKLVEMIHQLKSLTEGLNVDLEPLLLEWREVNQQYQQALLDYQRSVHSLWFNLAKYKPKKTPVKQIRKRLWSIVFGLIWFIGWLWYASKFTP